MPATAPDPRRNSPEHPWRGIGLHVYERHMEDPRVGQLQRLRDITGEQLAAYPFRTIGILGIAGGNGLDLIDPQVTQAVYGYDINADYPSCRTGRGLVWLHRTVHSSVAPQRAGRAQRRARRSYSPSSRRRWPGLPAGQGLPEAPVPRRTDH
ncbi:hypothetical protein [Streptomyces sp. LN785]|uniref:hypothetical protein n=1 Tax=Streptomyces sp. LN785 TaxID=3112983 RepID=UPI003711F5F2